MYSQRSAFLVQLFSVVVMTFLALRFAAAQGVPRAPLHSLDMKRQYPLQASFRDPNQPRSASPLGLSNFLPARTYSSGGYSASSVAVGDLNGDSNPDLVVANWCASGSGTCDGVVSVRLGNGDGTVQPAVSYDSGGQYAYSVAIADVNADGSPDLLVATQCTSGTGYCSGMAAVLLGNGDGTFQSAVTYMSGGSSAYSVAVADVNRDGKPDLLVANLNCPGTTCTNGALGVLLGNGDGTFQPAVSYDSGGDSAASVAVADLNGDGKPDLVVTNECTLTGCLSGGGIAAVLLGNGDGTFQAAVSYDSGGYGAGSVRVSDVNGDKKPDLEVVNSCASRTSCASGRVGVLLGNGDGTFQPAVSYDSGGYEPNSIVTTDLNGDGKIDLVIANACGDSTCMSGSVATLLGNGDGTFQAAVSYNSGGLSASSVAVGDLNGDGNPDVLVSNQCADSGCTNGSVGVLLTARSIATLNPTALNFGPQALQTTSPAQRISLFNNGPLPITVTSLNIQGDFAVSADSCNKGVKPSTHCDVYVTFTPTGTGPRTGWITFVDTSSDSPHSALLSGTGTSGSTITLTAQPKVSVYGQPVTFQALVVGPGPAKPTGQVSFLSGATTLGTVPLSSSGTANLSFAGLGAGTDHIVAQYDGDSIFPPSTSAAVVETVSKASTTTALLSSHNPSSVNQAVTLSVTVIGRYGGTPTGLVTFKQGATILGTSTLLNGAAKWHASFSHAGTLGLSGVYSGDSNFLSSSNAISQVVNKAATTTALTSSTNPSTLRQPVTFTVTVTPKYGGTVNGMVTIKDGATTLKTLTVTKGKASFTTSTLISGKHNLTATYNGSANFSGSSGRLTQTVK